MPVLPPQNQSPGLDKCEKSGIGLVTRSDKIRSGLAIRLDGLLDAQCHGPLGCCSNGRHCGVCHICGDEQAPNGWPNPQRALWFRTATRTYWTISRACTDVSSSSVKLKSRGRSDRTHRGLSPVPKVHMCASADTNSRHRPFSAWWTNAAVDAVRRPVHAMAASPDS